MARIINLHEESLYLQGARDMLLALEQTKGMPQWHKEKDGGVYNESVFREILTERESLRKFLKYRSWRYTDHEKNKKGKLIKVKTIFE